MTILGIFSITEHVPDKHIFEQLYINIYLITLKTYSVVTFTSKPWDLAMTDRDAVSLPG